MIDPLVPVIDMPGTSIIGPQYGFTTSSCHQRCCPWEETEDNDDDSNWQPLDSTTPDVLDTPTTAGVSVVTTRSSSSTAFLLQGRRLSFDSGSDHTATLEEVEVETTTTTKEFIYMEEEDRYLPRKRRRRRILYRPSSWWSLFTAALVFCLLMLLSSGWWPISSCSTSKTTGDNDHVDDKSIYVFGGGFSGFWFTLGRLQSLPDPLDHEYYCFSAGCLAAVAVLQNSTVDEMIEMAQDARDGWMVRGEMDRYQVVPRFLDNIFQSSSSSSSPLSHQSVWNNETLLSKLHILTTMRHPYWSWGVQMVIRSPQSLDELRIMLRQTTWIPFAVGRGLWHDGHMDGALSIWQHPKCARSAGLAIHLDLLFNALNIGLGRDKATRFWNMGLQYGL
ncbi:hypothetical protein ACA910_010467 [Epithemia clementina (nom. ined.)]